MKVTVNKNNEGGSQYPCLMIANDGDIVFFYKESEGVKIKNPSGSIIKTGRYFSNYYMASFELFKGSITLEND